MRQSVSVRPVNFNYENNINRFINNKLLHVVHGQIVGISLAKYFRSSNLFATCRPDPFYDPIVETQPDSCVVRLC